MSYNIVMNKPILKLLAVIVAAIAAIVVIFILYLTVTEYKPEDRVMTGHDGSASRKALEGEEYTILTWNTGYACLGENADFFMDGGKGVQTATLSEMIVNLDAMELELKTLQPDIIFLQEVDLNSKRSFRYDQYAQLYEGLKQPVDLIGAYTTNIRAAFIPYPFPQMIGHVESGIATMSCLELTTASERVALPTAFSWPVSTVNFKRCLLVSRAPIVGSDKELVLINLHLEAYDDGEGKIAQTNILKELLESEAQKGNFVIAGGDFNQIFSSVNDGKYPAREGIWQAGFIDENDFGEGFDFYMDNTYPTCRSLDKPYAGADKESFQYYMVDGFIVSSSLTNVSCETLQLDFKNTDHNPVMLRFTIPQENLE